MNKPLKRITTTFADPGTIEIEDCTQVYGDREIYDTLDHDNDCEHDSGHLYLTQCGETRCVHCRKRVT